jgi:hypothetical protein
MERDYGGWLGPSRENDVSLEAKDGVVRLRRN